MCTYTKNTLNSLDSFQLVMKSTSILPRLTNDHVLAPFFFYYSFKTFGVGSLPVRTTYSSYFIEVFTKTKTSKSTKLYFYINEMCGNITLVILFVMNYSLFKSLPFLALNTFLKKILNKSFLVTRLLLPSSSSHILFSALGPQTEHIQS